MSAGFGRGCRWAGFGGLYEEHARAHSRENSRSRVAGGNHDYPRSQSPQRRSPSPMRNDRKSYERSASPMSAAAKDTQVRQGLDKDLFTLDDLIERRHYSTSPPTPTFELHMLGRKKPSENMYPDEITSPTYVTVSSLHSMGRRERLVHKNSPSELWMASPPSRDVSPMARMTVDRGGKESRARWSAKAPAAIPLHRVREDPDRAGINQRDIDSRPLRKQFNLTGSAAIPGAPFPFRAPSREIPSPVRTPEQQYREMPNRSLSPLRTPDQQYWQLSKPSASPMRSQSPTRSQTPTRSQSPMRSTEQRNRQVRAERSPMRSPEPEFRKTNAFSFGEQRGGADLMRSPEPDFRKIKAFAFGGQRGGADLFGRS